MVKEIRFLFSLSCKSISKTYINGSKYIYIYTTECIYKMLGSFGELGKRNGYREYRAYIYSHPRKFPLFLSWPRREKASRTQHSYIATYIAALFLARFLLSYIERRESQCLGVVPTKIQRRDNGQSIFLSTSSCVYMYVCMFFFFYFDFCDVAPRGFLSYVKAELGSGVVENTC